jgi:ribosomal-protein-alanine N-acetyltransferase
MHLDTPLQGPRLQLRCLRDEDVTARYVAWLNDPEVNRYLELRFQTHALAPTREFVRTVNATGDNLLLGMFIDGGARHIGNIKLGPINPHHHRADIGLLIGDRGAWGQGYATEAIALVTAHGFNRLKLGKLTAGCYGGNQGSVKAFQRAGYTLEAVLPRHWHTAEGIQDGLLLGLTAEQYAQGPGKT